MRLRAWLLLARMSELCGWDKDREVKQLILEKQSSGKPGARRPECRGLGERWMESRHHLGMRSCADAVLEAARCCNNATAPYARINGSDGWEAAARTVIALEAFALTSRLSTPFAVLPSA